MVNVFGGRDWSAATRRVKFNFEEDDWDNGSIDLDEISEMFFNEWTQQTGWLFKELVIKLPPDLKYLLSENKDDNKRSGGSGCSGFMLGSTRL